MKLFQLFYLIQLKIIAFPKSSNKNPSTWWKYDWVKLEICATVSKKYVGFF